MEKYAIVYNHTGTVIAVIPNYRAKAALTRKIEQAAKDAYGLITARLQTPLKASDLTEDKKLIYLTGTEYRGILEYQYTVYVQLAQRY
ncbi:MAG: hypothetical protein H6550_16280 [Chitinophagales bacterium]|nr:hypothetical protein [Chitinophagales bacterium]